MRGEGEGGGKREGEGEQNQKMEKSSTELFFALLQKSLSLSSSEGRSATVGGRTLFHRASFFGSLSNLDPYGADKT